MNTIDVVFSLAVVEFFLWQLFFGFVWNALFGSVTDIGRP